MLMVVSETPEIPEQKELPTTAIPEVSEIHRITKTKFRTVVTTVSSPEIQTVVSEMVRKTRIQIRIQTAMQIQETAIQEEDKQLSLHIKKKPQTIFAVFIFSDFLLRFIQLHQQKIIFVKLQSCSVHHIFIGLGKHLKKIGFHTHIVTHFFGRSKISCGETSIGSIQDYFTGKIVAARISHYLPVFNFQRRCCAFHIITQNPIGIGKRRLCASQFFRSGNRRAGSQNNDCKYAQKNIFHFIKFYRSSKLNIIS